MQNIHYSGTPHSVDGAMGITPVVFNNLEYAGAFTLPWLGVRMPAAKLG
jgi:threonine/homoserine/homoserine lactone efflux protein